MPAHSASVASGEGRPVPDGAVLVAATCSPEVKLERLRRRRSATAAACPVLHHLGLDDEVVAAVDWWDLDRTLEPDHLTSLYVPGALLLRRADGRPGDGPPRRSHGHPAGARPWDRAQTHGSLMPHLVEETYEGARRAGGGGRGRRPTLMPTPTSRRRSWETCCSRSSSTPRLADEAGYFRPGWRGEWRCTTSSSTATRTSSATSMPTTRTRSSPTGSPLRRARKAAAASPRASPARCPP